MCARFDSSLGVYCARWLPCVCTCRQCARKDNRTLLVAAPSFPRCISLKVGFPCSCAGSLCELRASERACSLYGRAALRSGGCHSPLLTISPWDPSRQAHFVQDKCEALSGRCGRNGVFNSVAIAFLLIDCFRHFATILPVFLASLLSVGRSFEERDCRFSRVCLFEVRRFIWG